MASESENGRFVMNCPKSIAPAATFAMSRNVSASSRRYSGLNSTIVISTETRWRLGSRGAVGSCFPSRRNRHAPTRSKWSL
jgi:hypothetical protein